MSDIRADAEHVALCDDLWAHGADESDLFEAVRRGQRVAAAWLKDHPADDGDAVSREWMVSAGFKPEDGELLSDSWLVIENAFLEVTRGDASWMLSEKEGTDVVTLPDLHTRGDVRRLCSTLGIQLKEKS